GELLARSLRRGAQGPARPLPEASLAGESSGGAGCQRRAAAKLSRYTAHPSRTALGRAAQEAPCRICGRTTHQGKRSDGSSITMMTKPADAAAQAPAIDLRFGQ